MRLTENLGPNASVKDIAKNMNFGMMGGMSLTQKKLMEKKQKEEEMERKRKEEEEMYARMDQEKQERLTRQT
jgi:hypothetical protein